MLHWIWLSFKCTAELRWQQTARKKGVQTQPILSPMLQLDWSWQLRIKGGIKHEEKRWALASLNWWVRTVWLSVTPRTPPSVKGYSEKLNIPTKENKKTYLFWPLIWVRSKSFLCKSIISPDLTGVCYLSFLENRCTKLYTSAHDKKLP